MVVAELKPERADAVRAALQAANVEHWVTTVDVRVQAQVDTLMGEIDQRFGKLDILVNNVGTASAPKRFEETTDEDWDFEYQINLRHMLMVTRAAIPLMRKTGTGGSIINLSSIEAFRGIPLMTVYGAFKSAVIGFTQSLALEVGYEGIRVNAIAPETTESEVITPSKWIRPGGSRRDRQCDSAGPFRHARRRGRMRGVPRLRAFRMGDRHHHPS